MRKSLVSPESGGALFSRIAFAAAPHLTGHSIMDAERINQIGSNLVDLSARTVDLRRYL